jgi:hypothetical protein
VGEVESVTDVGGRRREKGEGGKREAGGRREEK